MRITNAYTQTFRIAASGSELKVANPKGQIKDNLRFTSVPFSY